MAFEDKLRSALEDAVKFCNEGSTPDEAVCKAASAHEFNNDQTDRLVETLNTAITINQYKQASDRTASFPLAHKDKVAAMMLDADKVLGKEEKTAEVNHIYFDYSKPAYDYIAHEDDVIEKAAEKEEKTTGLSRDNLAYLLVNRMKLVKNAADFAANIAGMMKSDLVSQLYGLAETVKKAGVAKYARFKAATEHNDITKELDKVLPVEFKKAECHDSFIDDSDLGDLEKTAAEMSETLHSMKDLRSQADSMHKQAEKMNSEISTAFIGEEEGPSTFLSLFKSAQARPGGMPGFDMFAQTLTQLANTAQERDALQQRVDRLQRQVDNADDQKKYGLNELVFGKGVPQQGILNRGTGSKAFDSLFDSKTKENDETIRTIENVKRSVMLQDLLTNDPIIAEADPDEVMSMYQSLLSTSPHVASNKEVVRSILRQAVNSIAISPFDAATWADLEKKQQEAALRTLESAAMKNSREDYSENKKRKA